MPDAVDTRLVDAGAASVWAFVHDYANWADLFPGYQGHRVTAPDASRWTVRGDVGIFSRVVDLDVRVVERAAPERVRFTVAGVAENLSGEGVFELTPVGPERTRLTLRMDVRPGGTMAPVIGALLEPRLGRLIAEFAGALAARIETGARAGR